MRQLTDVLGRPGFREAMANFGWLVVERAGRFAIGVIVGLVVARHLGPVRLGVLSYCASIVALAGFLPALGLDAVLKRDLLRAPGEAAELLASAFALRLATGAVAYLGLVAVAHGGLGFSDEEARLTAILGSVLLQPAFLLPDLWLQAHLKARVAVGAQLLALAVSSALRLWLVVTGASLVAFAWVVVIEMALVAAGVSVGARRAGLRCPLAAARTVTMRRLLGEAWPLMFSSLAVVVYMKIDEVMLRHLVGVGEVGIYAAAVKLSEVWYFIPTALGSSLLPALVRAREAGGDIYGRRQQEYYDLSAAVAYGLSVPMALLAPFIVRLAYGPAFVEAAPILAVHIWSSVFVFLGVARGQWLVNEGLQTFYMWTTAAGAVVNVGLNLVFIPRWGGLGAAWATVIAYGVSAWLATYLHPAARPTAALLTRALLIPLRGWRYLRPE